MRHEIIALHSAYSYPGAQFYPGCHQLKVTGGGGAMPAALVGFPGAYKASDAGITVDAYKGEFGGGGGEVKGEAWFADVL